MNVYEAPLVRPVTTVAVGAGEPVTVAAGWATPPRNGVTVYFVIVRAAVVAGAVQRTVACWLPALAVTPVGAAGAVGGFGVTAFEAAESAPVPLPFAAATLNVYVVPGSRLETKTDVAGGVPVTVAGVCAVEPMYGVTM